jgi:hypothetical protein
MGRHIQYAQLGLDEFRNEANIPADRLRLHLCWGN